ncbi:helix-turn-helix domain-containing protein [Paenibacillus luteus]|uniref:helix-turn-helix domain-containing protein n=1 Tax=Paenibacillus luteus TaxID=2545753 RepID=UPI00114222D5|nr:AraC family transcriptional regulator [Paenibacillus luteus]
MHYHLGKVHKHVANMDIIAEAGNCHSICIVMAGNGTIGVGDKSFEAKCSMAIVAERGHTVTLHAAPFHAMHVLRIEFSEKPVIDHGKANEDRAWWSWPLENSIKIKLNRQLMQLAVDLEREWSLGGNLDKLSGSEAAFVMLLNKLLELHGKIKQPTSHSWMENAIRYIKENYRKPLTRKELAAIAGVSPEHFSREFMKHSGKTFKAYITELRIRSAQEQLLGSNSDLFEIALQVGYQDGFYLSRKFKQFVGTAPTIYLKKPKKIASLTYNYSASLLALGITPSVAVISNWVFNHFRGSIDNKSAQWHDNVPAQLYDTIRPTRPDLILDYSLDEERAAELRAIAPLIHLPFEELPWDEQFRYIADVVDKGREAENCLNRLQALIERANQRLDLEMGKRGTAVVIELGMDKCYVFGDKWGRGTHVLYDPLQFAPPECLLQGGRCKIGYEETTLEVIRDYAADFIFYNLPDNAEERSRVLAFMKTESWGSLAAVKNKQAYRIEGDAFYGFDPASTKKQLTDMVALLTRGNGS